MNQRAIFLLIFLCCAALLGFGLYLQHAKGLDPCPLCVLQRYVFVLVAIITLIAALHGPRRAGRAVYALGLILGSIAGLALSGRHVWLEHLPKDQVPACGPGLQFILDAFPLSKALPMIFQGSGECANVAWRFLGLSIAEWALVWFLLFLLTGLWLIVRRKGT
jgi:disulfide bond formation protein DsbB